MHAAAAGVSLAGLSSVVGWSADQVTAHGPDLQSLAALITSVGGVVAILLSTWLQVRSRRGASDEAKDELIAELVTQLVEAKKTEPRRRGRREET